MMEPFVQEQADNGCELLFIRSWMERDSGLTAGFTSRHGGVSSGEFGSLNCGLHVADLHADVVSNRHQLAEALHIDLQQCTYAEQVHSNQVLKLTSAHAGAGIDSREQAIPATDAFITNEPGLFPHMMFADCVPLYFYDSAGRAVGLAHAGWKGTLLQIATHTLELMQKEYGTKPEQVMAAIGPSIQSCCYEVNAAVASQFTSLMQQLNIPNTGETGHSLVYTSNQDGKYNVNLQQINRHFMIKAGIVPSHIEMSNLCTSCRTDLFFSHRKEAGKTGRMAAWIGLYE